MSDVTLVCCDGPIPQWDVPSIRYKREGGIVEVYINGTKVNVLDMDEWKWYLEALNRIA